MKTIEFKPEGKPTIIPPALSPQDESVRNEVLIEILPLVFHKLKNKLTPVLGYTQILKTRGADEYSRERLERIERNTSELTDALNFLKDYCKPRGCILRPVALDRVMEEMAPEWQAIANAAAARVFLELEPGLPELALDAGRMRVLLLNLADNARLALKAKPGGGSELRLSVRRIGASVKLSVLDNGRGMDEEERSGIWTPFFSRFPGQAGLGLTICERIIASHGAACAVFSAAGEFSRFEIDFSRAQATSEATKRTQS
jgi:two-component system nitrogen regulation sensor histidine kinase NtrY